MSRSIAETIAATKASRARTRALTVPEHVPARPAAPGGATSGRTASSVPPILRTRLSRNQATARAGRPAPLAVQEAVQMHGGMGMTDDLDLGLFMKRARVLEELFGDAGFHTDRAAQLGGY